MKILVVGSGGREHALVWKLGQSKRVEKVYCAPGNAGIAEDAACVPIKAGQIQKLIEFVKEKKIDLTVVGPEAPLAAGIVDEFKKQGLGIFGPTQAAARLESSKTFAKNIMKKYGVPTGFSETFSEHGRALDYIKGLKPPYVIKADGLAAGKGVIIAVSLEEAIKALDDILLGKVFGDAGRSVLIEQYLEGEEASVLAVVDGSRWVALPSAQDHKRVYDQDTGPNTGGMGAYSPAPVVTRGIAKEIHDRILGPMVKGMNAEGTPYSGVLYAGLMITRQGPQVIEFNVRFGDPETQAILPAFPGDLAELLGSAARGNILTGETPDTHLSCACVVLASGGYPGNYESGKEIKGLWEAGQLPQTKVFHAGTASKEGKIVTAGGRVLGVTAWDKGFDIALERAYAAVNRISFEGMHYRKDIGWRALKNS